MVKKIKSILYDVGDFMNWYPKISSISFYFLITLLSILLVNGLSSSFSKKVNPIFSDYVAVEYSTGINTQTGKIQLNQFDYDHFVNPSDLTIKVFVAAFLTVVVVYVILLFFTQAVRFTPDWIESYINLLEFLFIISTFIYFFYSKNSTPEVPLQFIHSSQIQNGLNELKEGRDAVIEITNRYRPHNFVEINRGIKNSIVHFFLYGNFYTVIEELPIIGAVLLIPFKMISKKIEKR
ncbi:hypothetical protein P7E02_12490 [Enterococcus hulanensis]|uniref:hypothetical protein n=1 Tax=Enterococcus hulanensis TaxID=2559929 RepID=UPI0028917452|nr:hypothetical protein [Enterococcus hulanensis]MDT2660692.1 hypothetical protein [Enterococcus hulanensis]